MDKLKAYGIQFKNFATFGGGGGRYFRDLLAATKN